MDTIFSTYKYRHCWLPINLLTPIKRFRLILNTTLQNRNLIILFPTHTIRYSLAKPAFKMCNVTWVYYKCNCLKGTNEEECENKILATKIRTHTNPIVDRFRDESWAKIFEAAQESCLSKYKGTQELLDYNCPPCDRKLAEEALTKNDTTKLNAGSWI